MDQPTKDILDLIEIAVESTNTLPVEERLNIYSTCLRAFPPAAEKRHRETLSRLFEATAQLHHAQSQLASAQLSFGF